MGTILTILSLLWKGLTKYGPLIRSLIEFIEMTKDENARKEAMATLDKGFQYAKETGDPSLLEESIKSHCDSNGCHFP